MSHLTPGAERADTLLPNGSILQSWGALGRYGGALQTATCAHHTWRPLSPLPEPEPHGLWFLL